VPGAVQRRHEGFDRHAGLVAVAADRAIPRPPGKR
jgi:hypothetical protein